MSLASHDRDTMSTPTTAASSSRKTSIHAASSTASPSQEAIATTCAPAADELASLRSKVRKGTEARSPTPGAAALATPSRSVIEPYHCKVPSG